MNAFGSQMPDMPQESPVVDEKARQAAESRVAACSYVVPFPASMLCGALAAAK
jgi:hypothetical protein